MRATAKNLINYAVQLRVAIVFDNYGDDEI